MLKNNLLNDVSSGMVFIPNLTKISQLGHIIYKIIVQEVSGMQNKDLKQVV
jgi:hypothetical protein